MRNLKRVLSLALALVMVLGMMVITTSAADYTDAEEITYTEAVEVMSAIGILKGNPDGTFNPQGTLKRQEAAKILAFVCMGTEADEYLIGSTKSFDDVAADHWAAKYIAYCKNLGIINGVNDAQTLFNPTGTLTTVQFAKMLLVAIEVEGTYTGAGWEEAVKDAVAEVGTMAATGIKIDNSDITREEACELALAAMKHGETYSKGYYYVGMVDEFGYAATYSEMFVMAKTMLEGETPAFNKANIKKHSATKGSLLLDTYAVTFNPDATDKFGRPGNSYTYEVEGKDEPVVMFYADAPVATFEGPVAEKAIFAAAGVKNKTATSVSYKLIEDGSDKFEGQTFTAAKEIKNVTNSANWIAAGTGYGIKTELYKEIVDETPVYTLVSVRDYLGVVTDVTPADEDVEDSKRTITVDLTVVPSGNETTTEIVYETEDFAKKDVVIVNVAGGEIQTIAAAKTVKGTPTKIAKGAVTIAGTEYVASQNAYGVAYALGTAGEWYLDSMGNLIGDAYVAPKAAVYYGIFLKAEGQLYVEESESLLDTEEGKEAAEVVQILTADNKAVVYNTAWEYTYNAAETEITGVDFLVANDQSDVTPAVDDTWTGLGADITLTAGRLVKYTLDKNGAIKTISMVAENNAADGKLETGKAVLGAGYTKVVTDKTVFFLKVDDRNPATTDKFVAYTGYKSVPTMTFTNAVYYVEGKTATGASDGTYAVVVIDGTAVAPAPAKTNYIYFADTAYTEQWDAEEEAVAYIYENVYLNGEKSTVTFYAKQAMAVKGALYEYTVNAKTGALNITYGTNLLANHDAVTLIHEDFFVANGVNYVDADTAYYQVTKTGLTKVEALPTVKATESIVVNCLINNYDAKGNVTTANTVYFSVVDSAKVPTHSTPAEMELDEMVYFDNGTQDYLSVDVKGIKFATSYVVELCDAQGNVIGTLTSKLAAGTYPELTAIFRMFEYNSSSWTQDWTPNKNVAPAFYNVVIDGTYIGSGVVASASDPDTGAVTAMTATKWADIMTPAPAV